MELRGRWGYKTLPIKNVPRLLSISFIKAIFFLANNSAFSCEVHNLTSPSTQNASLKNLTTTSCFTFIVFSIGSYHTTLYIFLIRFYREVINSFSHTSKAVVVVAILSHSPALFTASGCAL